MNQTELKILVEIAKGNDQIKSIAQALKKHHSQIYRTIKRLEFLTVKEGIIVPEKLVFLNQLFQLLSTYPNLTQPFSNSGLEILLLLTQPKTAKELIQETKLKRSSIFIKLRQFKAINLITKDHRLNQKVWPQVQDFLEEYLKHRQSTDRRVPINAVIYYKNQQEIVFSLKTEFKASLTAFSKYKDFGIELLLPTNYYYLPQKTLSIKEIFIHSLYITEKELEPRNLIYLTLFYLKHKNYLTKIKSPILDSIKRILAGEIISNYPSLKEIKEKAEIYDIKV